MNITDDTNLKIIQDFLLDKNNTKFLLIQGPPGSGKSTLANDIFKNTIKLIIDSSHIKYYKNIREHINDIISKNNITLMFETPKRRTLIIDDYHIFKKYDKTNYKHLLDFLSTDNRIKKIIINDYFDPVININNNYLLNINITPKTLKLLNINLPNHNLLELISKYNSNIYKISKYSKSIMINDDHYNSNDNIMKNLLLNKYNIYDLENIITHNDTMIILCLLELIIHNIPLKYNTCIKNIYNNYVIADIYEKYFFTYNIKYIREFILYLTCSCTRYVNQDNIFINNYSYNKYNSKSSIIF